MDNSGFCGISFAMFTLGTALLSEARKMGCAEDEVLSISERRSP
jgi:hypothetical protein